MLLRETVTKGDGQIKCRQKTRTHFTLKEKQKSNGKQRNGRGHVTLVVLSGVRLSDYEAARNVSYPLVMSDTQGIVSLKITSIYFHKSFDVPPPQHTLVLWW